MCRVSDRGTCSAGSVFRFEPFIIHRDTTAAEPHIRSPSITADTKIPHARGLRLGNGTNLYDGISQPERCQVRSPISAGSIGAQRIPLSGRRRQASFITSPSGNSPCDT
jgi:hypothetical protein